MDHLTDYLEPIKKEPDEVKPPTESDYRNFNKQFVTRQLPVVKTCRHKFCPDLPPRNNCHECWWCYLNADEDEIFRLHDLYKNHKQDMIKQYGTKFVNLFVKFMSTAVKLKNGEPRG